MAIQVNGEKRHWDGPLTVLALLEALGIRPAPVAVERNLQIVLRNEMARENDSRRDTIRSSGWWGRLNEQEIRRQKFLKTDLYPVTCERHSAGSRIWKFWMQRSAAGLGSFSSGIRNARPESSTGWPPVSESHRRCRDIAHYQ